MSIIPLRSGVAIAEKSTPTLRFDKRLSPRVSEKGNPFPHLPSTRTLIHPHLAPRCRHAGRRPSPLPAAPAAGHRPPPLPTAPLHQEHAPFHALGAGRRPPSPCCAGPTSSPPCLVVPGRALATNLFRSPLRHVGRQELASSPQR
jgi:hypothetical protein